MKQGQCFRGCNDCTAQSTVLGAGKSKWLLSGFINSCFRLLDQFFSTAVWRGCTVICQQQQLRHCLALPFHICRCGIGHEFDVSVGTTKINCRLARLEHSAAGSSPGNQQQAWVGSLA